MAEQRTYGTGPLTERPIGSGRWYFRYVVGVDPVTGKMRRKAITIYAKSKRAAQAEATRILGRITPVEFEAVFQVVDDVDVAA